jgi:hypothetical protein
MAQQGNPRRIWCQLHAVAHSKARESEQIAECGTKALRSLLLLLLTLGCLLISVMLQA